MANAFIDGLYTTSAKVFLMKTGQVKDLSNENNFHPNANVNGLFVHIEDGVSTNIVTLNFAPSKKPNWATHDFPLLYIDTIEHTIVGELTPRTFARYFNYIPSQLLAMNLNSSSIMDVGVTVKQQSGVNVLGAFNTLSALQAEYNNQEVLEGFDEDNTIAYVYEVGENGYYMVDYNSISGLYEWVLKTNDYSTYLSTKPYNMFTIKVQRGYQNTKPITTLEDEQYRLLWAYMGSFAGLIEAIGNRVTILEEEMDLVEERLDVVEPIVEQHGHELEVVKQSDWDFYDLVSDDIDFANSRNGWVQVGSDIYVFGGIQMRGTSFSPYFAYQYGNRAFKYNLVTKTWTRLENLPAWFSEQRAVHKDGYIYLFGGNGIIADPAVTPPTGYTFLTNRTYRYDIANDEYTLMAEAPIIINLTSGAILIDSKVYVIVDAQITGGAQQFLANSKVYVYDITENTWEAKASTNTVFDRGYAVYYDGLIYVHRSLKFQAYNPTTDTWITNLTPPTYGVVHTGLPQVYNGRLIIGSGWQSSASKNNPYIQYYDVVLDTWFVSTRLELDYQPLGYGTLAMYDNKLFYFGGYHNEVISISNKYIQTFNLERMRCAEVDDVKANLEAYKEVTNGRLDDVEDDIADILDGTQTVKKAEQDASGNVIDTTYETKADATSKKAEIDGRLDTAESDINAVEGRLDTAEGEIDTLQTDVQALETANMIKSYTYNPSTHVLTFTYFDNSTTSFDLPLESAIVDASYDNVTKDITFTLQSGATLVVPLDDLVSGLASETWVTTYFIPKTALKTTFSATPLDTNVISEKLAKDSLDLKVDLFLDKPLTLIGGKSLKEFFEESNDNRIINLISNGNFENGTTGFIPFASTQNVVSNKLRNTGDGTSTTPFSYQTTTGLSINDKVYIHGKLKALSNGISSLMLQIAGAEGIASVASPIINVEYEISSVLNVVAGSNNYRFRHSYSSAGLSLGSTAECDYMEAIKLNSLVTDGVLSEATTSEYESKIYSPYYGYYIVLADYGLTKLEAEYLYNIYTLLQSSESNMVIDELNRIEKELKYVKNLEINLPSKLYALVGKELNVYFDNLVLNPNKYKKDVVVSIGTQYSRKFVTSPSSDGTQSFVIKYEDEKENVTSKTSSIVISPTSKGNGVTKKVLVIGDSTTAGGIVTGELLTLFGSDVMDITLIGTQGTSPNLHEGRSGWTINQFVTSGSPFFIGGTLDFSSYMTTNSFDGVDIVIINLGINDIFNYTDNTLLQIQIDSMIIKYEQLIESIKTYNTNVEIGLAITIPPASSQDAFGYSYTNGQTRERYLINLHEWQKRMIEEFDLREDEKLYLVPIHTNLDTEYNFPTTTTTPNSRNTTSITVQNNGVHPANSGYYQIADVMYYWIKSRG